MLFELEGQYLYIVGPEPITAKPELQAKHLSAVMLIPKARYGPIRKYKARSLLEGELDVPMASRKDAYGLDVIEW